MQDSSRPRPDGERNPDICVVLNARSGKRDEGALARIEAAMDRHRDRFALRMVPKGGNPVDSARRAADEGFGTLVAAGGDGTISAVASVAHERDLTLGAVPMGTFNYFARGLDLPEEPQAALDLIAGGAARDVPVGEVNGSLFLNNASLGLYPAILARREGTYDRWGRSRVAAHWSVLSTVMRFQDPLHLHVTVDGRALDRRTPLAFVARSAHQLELFGLDGADDVRAGRFAVFLAPDAGRAGLARFALRLAAHSMERGRDFDYVTGTTIDMETDAPSRLVARDGERERMEGPFRFRMSDRKLRVIAPGTDEAPAH